MHPAKALLAPLRTAMVDFAEGPVRKAMRDLVAPDAVVHMCHPFGDMAGADLFDRAYGGLSDAWPDLERRDLIVILGEDDDGTTWVGCCGAYMGTFTRPWLGIPPTNHPVEMRFHEFYRVEGNQVTEIQAIWDIPQVMIATGVWPMAPSLGRDGPVPGPATQDGLAVPPGDADAARAHVLDMLAHMIRHPAQGGPEVMNLERFWDPRMMWYGPGGIGTMRGIDGFRRNHQIPFLSAMPDRGQNPEGTKHVFFAEGAYVAVTGWPNMRQTLTADGWMGIAPSGQTLLLRSLDFWRLHNGLIRENWVLVDILDAYRQLGVDVFRRLRERTGDTL